MTNIYLVRHAKVIYTADEHSRALSEEGTADIVKVTRVFEDIKIDKIVSSPYKRAMQTIEGVASNKNLVIECHDDLRERKVAQGFIDDFDEFVAKQWLDFNFKLDEGESLIEVQKRGNDVIRHLLDTYKDKSIIIGTHGTFLAVQLNYYDSKYDLEFWKTIKMPDIFRFEFKGNKLLSIENLSV